jgi:superfamily II DNA or RNA helicase
MKKCTIIVLDEVNVKLSGLELPERQKIVNKFKYEIPGARHLPAVRLGRWDGKVSFAQLGGSTYTNLLPEILPIIDAAGYDIELDDRRDYNTTFKFDEVKEDSYSHIMWPTGHVMEGKPIMLRDYQVHAINTYLQNPQSIQSLPTGAGKTIICASLSQRCEQYGRTLIIVPNKDLVRQTEEDYRNLGLDCGVFFGTRKEYNKQHTICTWQSLNSMFKKSKAGEAVVDITEFIEGVVCVIVDEVHSAKADVLKTLLTSTMARMPIRWGLTGTIPKEEFEFRSLQVSIGEIVNKLAASDLQDAGVLANCHVKILQLVDHSEFPTYQQEYKYLVSNADRLAAIAQQIPSAENNGNTLILVNWIATGEALASLIPDSVFLHGATSSDERKGHYKEVANVDNKTIIATYGIAAVGLNIPRIFNLVLFEPGKSFVRVIQSIGRGLRMADDKDFVQILDITSNCRFSKRHLLARKKFYSEANYPFEVKKIEWK